MYHALGAEDDPSEPPSLTFRPGKAAKGLGGRYKLIVAANRDEFLVRPSMPMHFWEGEGVNILAGERRRDT